MSTSGQPIEQPDSQGRPIVNDDNRAPIWAIFVAGIVCFAAGLLVVRRPATTTPEKPIDQRGAAVEGDVEDVVLELVDHRLAAPMADLAREQV